MMDMDALMAKLPITAPDDFVTVPDDGFPEMADFTKHKLVGAHGHVCAGLDELQARSSIESAHRHYYDGLRMMMRFIAEQVGPDGGGGFPGMDQRLNQMIFESYGVIADTLVEMEAHQGDFGLFLGRFERVMEEGIHIMTLMNRPILDIPGMLTAAGPQPIEGITKQSFIFNSGMRCISMIVDALRHMQHAGHRPAALPEVMQAGFASDMYFEARHHIQWATRTLHLGIEEGVPNPEEAAGAALLPGAAPMGFDVFFFDFLPNNVAIEAGVSGHNAIMIIRGLLVGRAAGNPVTVVIDSTTDWYAGERVAELINHDEVRPALAAGVLNIVVVDSLAKFAQAGFDKYTGGVIQCYNNQSPYFRDFSAYLGAMMGRPEHQLSKKAARFFSMMLNPDYGEPIILEHLRRVRIRTNAMVGMLCHPEDPEHLHPPITGGARLQLIPRDGGHGGSDIPVLGLRLNHWELGDNLIRRRRRNRIYLAVHAYIVMSAQEQRLPLTMRGSFGFGHSTLSEVVSPSTLRFTMGLEPDEIMHSYITIIRRASLQFGAHFGVPESRVQIGVDFGLSIMNNLGNKARYATIIQRMSEYHEAHGDGIPFARFLTLCHDPDTFDLAEA